jgi:hypothetical protein
MISRAFLPSLRSSASHQRRTWVSRSRRTV